MQFVVGIATIATSSQGGIFSDYSHSTQYNIYHEGKHPNNHIVIKNRKSVERNFLCSYERDEINANDD